MSDSAPISDPDLISHSVPIYTGPQSSPTPDNGTVCAACAQLSYEQIDTPEGQLYHNSWGALIESAEQGCPLCTFFATAPRYDELDSELDPPEQSGSIILRIYSDSFRTRLEVLGCPPDREPFYNLCLSNDIDVHTSVPVEKITGRRRFADRASEKALERVQSWLHACETRHLDCRKIETSPLPTRVLDISYEDSVWNIRLSNGDGIVAAYIALSHCWGQGVNEINDQLSKCTSGNIDQLFQGFSIDELPPLYRDAVIMTQKLGKRYLWIDALCIIQDSKDDWSKECARMTDVYAQSYLTIFAASCENSQEGFIKATTAETYTKLTTIPGSPNQYIYSRHLDKPYIKTPLMKRAWVFQEKLLSSRVLRFTSYEIGFLCDQHEYSEGGNSDRCYYGCYYKQLLYNAGALYAGNPYSQWLHLVESYSQLDLTYATDKLPALSGIASITQQRTGDDYVAGLWKNDLVAGLLWHIKDQKGTGANDETLYIAPTWSWASVKDYAVDYHLPDDLNLLQLDVVDVQVCLSTPNPFGEVSSAFLVVNAPLREFPTPCLTLAKVGIFREFVSMPGDASGCFRFIFDAGPAWRPKSKTLSCLPCIAGTPLAKMDIEEDWYFIPHGLALEPVDRENRIYKRVGVFCFDRAFDKKFGVFVFHRAVVKRIGKFSFCRTVVRIRAFGFLRVFERNWRCAFRRTVVRVRGSGIHRTVLRPREYIFRQNAEKVRPNYGKKPWHDFGFVDTRVTII